MKLISKLLKLSLICRNMFFLKNLLIHRVAASVDAKFINGLQIDCLIDVGANVGQFSTLCYYYNKTILIIAFEPISSCYKKLKEVLPSNKNIKLFNCALGNRCGHESIHISNKIDSSSILSFKEQSNIYPNTESIMKEKIKIDKLDNYVKYLNKENILLKIDVQGYEKNVLAGANNALKLVKYIYIELSFIDLYANQAHFSEICSILYKKNFYLASIENLHRKNGQLIQGDFLFQKKS